MSTWRDFAPHKALRATKPMQRRDQLRLDFPRQRQDSMTQSDLAREAERESKLYNPMVDSLRRHPFVKEVWRSDLVGTGRFHPKGGGTPRNVHIGMEGLSDIQGDTIFGDHFYIEVKRPGNVPSAAQRKFLKEARERGEIAIVVRSVEEAWRKLLLLANPEVSNKRKQYQQGRIMAWTPPPEHCEYLESVGISSLATSPH